ncbi:FHA domain-containing protein [Edaphobacter modestus]|nr:FHA domain-containing protein [Edaphobacter modestus]
MKNQKQLASMLDDLAVTGRLQDVALFTVEGRSDRIRKIRQVLSTLDTGVYLLGAGPYSQAIVPLRSDEIIIGRLATPLEPILDKPVDVFVNDAVGLLPREVSRVHCAVYRREGIERHDYWLIDRGSTCGTYLNGERLDQPSSDSEQELIRASRPLAHSDVISLGPAKINTFLFADLRG